MNVAHTLAPVHPRIQQLKALERVGVEIVDKYEVIFRCLQCGVGWSPEFLPGGGMPSDYWRCPNGCNSEVSLTA